MSAGRALKDLRVLELKRELESRGMPTSGNKAVLVQRLRDKMDEEGLDPEHHLFGRQEQKEEEESTAATAAAAAEDQPQEEMEQATRETIGTLHS